MGVDQLQLHASPFLSHPNKTSESKQFSQTVSDIPLVSEPNMANILQIANNLPTSETIEQELSSTSQNSNASPPQFVHFASTSQNHESELTDNRVTSHRNTSTVLKNNTSTETTPTVNPTPCLNLSKCRPNLSPGISSLQLTALNMLPSDNTLLIEQIDLLRKLERLSDSQKMWAMQDNYECYTDHWLSIVRATSLSALNAYRLIFLPFSILENVPSPHPKEVISSENSIEPFCSSNSRLSSNQMPSTKEVEMMCSSLDLLRQDQKRNCMPSASMLSEQCVSSLTSLTEIIVEAVHDLVGIQGHYRFESPMEKTVDSINNNSDLTGLLLPQGDNISKNASRIQNAMWLGESPLASSARTRRTARHDLSKDSLTPQLQDVKRRRTGHLRSVDAYVAKQLNGETFKNIPSLLQQSTESTMTTYPHENSETQSALSETTQECKDLESPNKNTAADGATAMPNVNDVLAFPSEIDPYSPPIVGVTYRKGSNSWCASWSTSDGTTCSRSFSANKHGFEVAKRKAIACKQNVIALLKEVNSSQHSDAGMSFDSNRENGKQTLTPGNTNVRIPFSGVRGVSYDTLHQRWRAYWRENGRNQTKHFSVSQYGERDAFTLACRVRKSAEERIRLNRSGQSAIPKQNDDNSEANGVHSLDIKAEAISTQSKLSEDVEPNLEYEESEMVSHTIEKGENCEVASTELESKV